MLDSDVFLFNEQRYIFDGEYCLKSTLYVLKLLTKRCLKINDNGKVNINDNIDIKDKTEIKLLFMRL